MEPLLELRDVTKRFGSKVALRSVSMSVSPGEMVGLVGPNGAGKSTLIRVSLGILTRDSGSVTLMGEDPLVSPRARESVGVVFERPSLPPSMPVISFLRRAARIKGASDEDVKRAVELAGLKGYEDRPFAHLSAGLKQRAAIAHAIIGSPRLIIADEPTSNLDPVERESVLELLVELKKQGASVLLSSHVLSEVLRVVDRIVVLKSGSVAISGGPEEILKGLRRVRVRTPEPEALAKELGSMGLKAATSGPEVIVQLEGNRDADLLDALAKAASKGIKIYGVDMVEPNIEELLR